MVARPTAFALVVLGGLSLSLSAPARADVAASRREAKQRFERAVSLADEGELDRALAELVRAYELVPNERVLLEIAEVQATLGHPVEATASLDALLAAPGSLGPDDIVRARSVREREAAKVAELAVESSVPGARVEIDNVAAGTTPLQGAVRVGSGTRVVGVVAPGFAPQRQTVTVVGKESRTVRFELIPLEARLAHLDVRTSLPGAEVLVDGQQIATTPLPAALPFAPGRYRVEVRRAGYMPATAQLEVAEGATSAVTLDPALDDAALALHAGTLEVRSSEWGAALAVDGRHVGVATPVKQVRLPPGPHALRIDKAGFVSAQRTVTITEGRTSLVQPVLTPTPETRAGYESRARGMRTLGWSLLVGGGAVAVAGSVMATVFSSQRNDAQATYDETLARSQAGGAGSCIDGCRAELDAAADDLDAAKTRQTIGFATAGAGVVVLGSGLLLLLGGDDPRKFDRPSLETARARPFRITPSFVGLPGGGGWLGLSGSM